MRGKTRDPMGNNNKNQTLGTCDEKDKGLTQITTLCVV